MHFYPDYKIADVLNEKAHLFFSFLDASYRLDAANKLELITISAAPYMSKDGIKEVIDNYKLIANDIINPGSGDNTPEEINKLKTLLQNG